MKCQAKLGRRVSPALSTPPCSDLAGLCWVATVNTPQRHGTTPAAGRFTLSELCSTEPPARRQPELNQDLLTKRPRTPRKRQTAREKRQSSQRTAEQRVSPWPEDVRQHETSSYCSAASEAAPHWSAACVSGCSASHPAPGTDEYLVPATHVGGLDGAAQSSEE